MRDVRSKLPELDDWSILETISLCLLKGFFGTEWLDRHTGASPKDKFLHTYWDGDLTMQNMYRFKIVNLSEMLINLVNMRGFNKIRQMIKDGDLESGYAELEVGKILTWNKVDFSFNIPINKEGKDYDITIKIGNKILCAETKCKDEITSKTIETIERTLKKASEKNLPKDRPCCIIVKLPQTWNVDGIDFDWALPQEACELFFKKTKRIVLVAFYFNLALEFDGFLRPIALCKEFKNPAHRFDQNTNWSLFSLVDAAPNDWIDLVKLSQQIS